jgi:uncharacterized protein (TIGR02118 family)
MTKRMILVTRRSDVSPENFRKYHTDRHAPIVAKMPGLRRYVQNPTFPAPNGEENEVSGIAEVWYDDEAAFQAAMHSPEAAAANESLTRFVDLSKTRVVNVEEHVVISCAPPIMRYKAPPR